ncbi:MFS transporter [Aliivibrio fischeri]|uniref:MFS transporter n=1 Tax=Aliivibrio fischeri TaxID=668 RepID=A0A510UM32_ALIFS|nr:MFS transporter [Aliivibrio fischeri]GEK15723.1 MFS transporter [Aliivibrio fischeri]
MITLYKNFSINIKLILITTLLSNIGIFMVIPFLAIYLNELNTINTVDVGIIIGVAFWCQRAGSLFGGILSDYFSVKKTLLIGLVIRVPGYLVLGFVSDFYLLLMSCSLIGLGSSIYLPAAKSYLVQATTDKQRVEVLSTRVVFSNIGVALGPVIGLVIFDISPSLLFTSVGAIFTVLLLLNYFLIEEKISSSIDKLNFRDFIHLALNYRILTIAITTFIFMALYMQIEVTIPLLAKELYNKSIVSAIFIINAAVVIIFQVYMSKWACTRLNNYPVVIGFLLFSISFYLLDSSIYSFWMLFLSVIMFTFAEIIFQIRLDYEATFVNEKMVASSFGIMSIAGAFGGLFGSYLGSSLYLTDFDSFSFWDILSGFTLILSIFSLINIYSKGLNYAKAFSNDKSS